jgi:predicted ATPase
VSPPSFTISCSERPDGNRCSRHVERHLVPAARRAVGGLVAAPRLSPYADSGVPRPHSPLIGRAGALAALVPLLRRADLVILAVARAAGITGTSAALVLDRLVQRLADKQLLLVLDNFEHVRDAAPDLDELLRRCPAVTALVTSRSPLRLGGERLVLVPPLPVPERGEAYSLSPDDKERHPAPPGSVVPGPNAVPRNTAAPASGICAHPRAGERFRLRAARWRPTLQS